MNTQFRKFASLAKACLPPFLCRKAKLATVGMRYRKQLAACQAGYEEYGDRYEQPVMFVAGLPKSGNTWLERMLSSFPGFHELLIPEVAQYEMQTGGSHDYDIPEDMFTRFEKSLVLTKMHVHGSEHNAQVLRDSGIHYAVLFRDLRDVAVSYFHYVQQTPWHGEYPRYRRLSLEAGLAEFGRQELPQYAQWVRSWQKNVDPELGMILRYEEMLADTIGVMRSLVGHFSLPADEKRIQEIVESHSFKNLSGGRSQGQANNQSFFRSGTSGGWTKHFTPELKDLYKEVIGEFLIEFGYETDTDW